MAADDQAPEERHMADLHPDPDSDPDANGAAGAERARAPGTPRWVQVFGIIAIVIIILLVVAQLLLGVQHGPGMHGPSGDADGATSTANGGVTGAGVGEPADADHAVRTIEVAALDTMAFEPSTITVSAGETITFEVTNTGQAVHEFTIGDAAMQEEHADAMAHIPEGMGHDLPNSINLQPGETKELTWRFGDAGEVEYACHVPGHYEAGMRGQLTVG
jgi:uncharacterized cupredoxin-like copper-binding protein